MHGQIVSAVAGVVRAAAYCRVSTDKDDQTNSFENQQRFFRAYIAAQPGWALYEIYADEGLSGTSTKKRAAFNRMIADARQGRFDRIVTKEISRFARNTLDSIHYTRALKQWGVSVYFMNDNIDTGKDDSEVFLTIKASMAQEESRATSSRVKWGQTQQMKRGVVFGRSCLGYDVRDGRMTIEPHGAEIVRLIFHKYVTRRKGTTVIARELREAGHRTMSGNVNWSGSVILKILRNEKYCGDLRQKKTFTPDYLTHEKKCNRGEEPQIYLRDHHPPIVSREIWDAAQGELARRNVRAKENVGRSTRHPLSGKIKCGRCAASFSARYKTLKSGAVRKVWRCATATAQGAHKRSDSGILMGCDIGRQLREDAALALVKRCVDELPLDRASMAADIAQLVATVSREGGCINQAQETQRQITAVTDKKRRMLDTFFAGRITGEELHMMKTEYDAEIAALTARLTAAEAQITRRLPDEAALTAQVAAILGGEADVQVFYTTLLRQITVHHSETELALHHLPATWSFPAI